jgi:hypothetical protein
MVVGRKKLDSSRLFIEAALLRNAGKSLDISTNPASRSDAAINWI